MQPITTEEAVLCLEYLDHDFYVYKNSGNGNKVSGACTSIRQTSPPLPLPLPVALAFARRACIPNSASVSPSLHLLSFALCFGLCSLPQSFSRPAPCPHHLFFLPPAVAPLPVRLIALLPPASLSPCTVVYKRNSGGVGLIEPE